MIEEDDVIVFVEVCVYVGVVYVWVGGCFYIVGKIVEIKKVRIVCLIKWGIVCVVGCINGVVDIL